MELPHRFEIERVDSGSDIAEPCVVVRVTFPKTTTFFSATPCLVAALMIATTYSSLCLNIMIALGYNHYDFIVYCCPVHVTVGPWPNVRGFAGFPDDCRSRTGLR